MRTTCKLLGLALAVMLSQTAIGFQTGNDVSTFWEKFKTAVIKGDKNTVATLSRFPIQMSYGKRSIRSKAELLRRWKEVVSEQSDAIKCFASKGPELDQSNSRRFSVACPDAAGNEVVIFQFERGRAGWKFVGLDNINE